MNFLFGRNSGSGLRFLLGLAVYRHIGLRRSRVPIAAWGLVVGPLGAGAIDNHFPTHEGLVVQDLYRALRFFHVGHVDEAVALRLVGVAVVNELDLADRTDSFEEFFQVVFGGIVGEVAHVQTGRFDLGWRRCLFAGALILASLSGRLSAVALTLTLALVDAATSGHAT